jgi:hypothetical protein
VELEQNPGTVEAVPLGDVAGDLDLASIDSSGVTPDQQIRVNGRMQVTEVTLDNGQGIRRFALASVIFQDTRLPVTVGNRTFGFYGIPVRSLTLDGVPMVRVPHVVRVRGFLRDTVHAGSEYLLDLTAGYRPGGTYVWGARATAVSDSVTIPVTSPAALRVLAPAGGTVLDRARDLRLRWQSDGNVEIVVSMVDPATGRTVPRAKFTPPPGAREAVVPARVLSGFGPGVHALTFIRANRYELPTLSEPRGVILVQAAAVSTVFVGLR